MTISFNITKTSKKKTLKQNFQHEQTSRFELALQKTIGNKLAFECRRYSCEKYVRLAPMSPHFHSDQPRAGSGGPTERAALR